VPALLAGLAVLGLAGAGVREILRSTGGGALVTHGPFLVPRSLIFEGLPSATARPKFSLSQFVIRNSPFEILSGFFTGPALAQPWTRQALGFFKADITGSEIITTVAGTGTAGFNGDNQAATSAQLNFPRGVAVDASGSLFIADNGNHRVRKVAAGTNIITTVAGTGTFGFNGDNQAATSAQLTNPFGLAVDASGNLFIADSGNARIRKVAAGTGIITTVAGTGTAGFNGDNQAATSALLNTPTGLALDPSGNLFIADRFNHRIRKVAAGTGIITTVAGTGTDGFGGDGGPAGSAQLNNPVGLALDPSGNLFIGDSFNHRIRRVAAGTGIITTVAGTGTGGFGGDGGPAGSARLANPFGPAVDASGSLFIADEANRRVRKVAAGTGIITTVAGTGAAGFAGDGGPATSAQLNPPAGVALDPSGNLFIADTINQRIRKVQAGTGPTPTPAPTPTATPAPTPTPTPTPTPSPTPTPTPTPTPVPTPTPRPTPTLIPTPTPLASPTPSPTPLASPTPSATPTPVVTPTPRVDRPSPPADLRAGVNREDCSVTITWSPNPAGEAVTGYRLFVGTSPERFNVFDGLEVGNVTQFRSGPNQPGTALVITVSAVNAAGEGPRAPVLSVPITAQACPPPVDKPTLLTPPSGASFFLVGAPTIRFTWTPVPGAASYLLEYTGPNRTFANPNAAGPDPVHGLGGAGGALGPVTATSLEITLNPIAPPGTYQLRVIGFDGLRLVGRSSDAVAFTLVPPLPSFVRPIDPRLADPRLRTTGILPFALDSRNPLTNQTVEEDLRPALADLTGGAVTAVRQDPATAVVQATGAPGVAFSFLPIGIIAGGGLTRQQAAPRLVLDEEAGTGTLITATGQRVVIMGAPPDLRAFIDLLRPQGATGVEVRPGQFLASLTTPGSSLSLRLSFALNPITGPPAFTRNPDGTATVVFGTGQGQTAVPVFADIPAFLGAVREMPGATNVRGTLDGLVTATLDGTPRRARPAFEVTPGSGAKRFLVEPDGGLAFDFGDGRRQRLTILP
jgi:sugar lactone lactonase YvrE